MEMNDTLGKLDMQVEAAIRKIEKQAMDIDKSVQLKIERVDSTGTDRISHRIVTVEKFISSFDWEDQKYPRSRALSDIASQLADVRKAGRALIPNLLL